MTRRKTEQQGSLTFLPGKMSTFRIREFDHQSGKWIMRRFQLGKFKDKKDAQKACNPIRTQVNERNNANPKKLYALLTFNQFIETYWKEYAKREGLQPATLDTDASLLKVHISPVFGEMKLRDIKPQHIGDFMNSLYSKKYSDGTIGLLYQFIRSLFTLAKQHDLIKKNPVRPKRHRPKSAKVRKPTLTPKQVGEVIQNLPNEVEKLLALLLSLTALRIGEALALRWMDFDSATGTITIAHTLYRSKLKKPKTEGSAATLQLERPLAALLTARYAQSPYQQPHDFIFCRVDGSALPYSTCLYHIHKAIEGAGIKRERSKHAFHIFRHTAGTLAYMKSRDLKAVQTLMRHSKMDTTANIYIHAGDEITTEQLGHLAGEILPNCDLTVTGKSEMVN